MKKTLALFGFFLLLTPVINAQLQVTTNTEISQTRKYTYQYTFENAPSEEAVKLTELALQKLLNVTEVKCQYKPDSKRGQFILTVVEKEIKSESQELFSPTMIKQTLRENGLQPIEFTVTEEIVK